ncbi:MAG: phosphodiester glycosidase family protein [Clostridiales bacterium]|nr:phosphodiester glycosidase family protein [Clostridiales bacterium]
MKRLIGVLLCLMLIVPAALAEEPVSFVEDVKADKLGNIRQIYDSPTLKYTVEKLIYDGEACYLTRVWVQDPARQIRKPTSTWRKNVKGPQKILARIDGVALAINGSGFVSPSFPEIPDNYPGKSNDYYYTPLGSLTVTDGEVFRNLEGVSYYGLALDEDGLQMYVDADNGEVLATNPVQTWSFYIECPMLRNNEDILPAEWKFADRRAARTVIGRLDRNNYLILTVSDERGRGVTLRRAAAFFQEHFDTEWVYNLDGGMSSALLTRKQGKKLIGTIYHGGSSIVDMMAFTE